jgi:hypothetical protein
MAAWAKLAENRRRRGFRLLARPATKNAGFVTEAGAMIV